MVAISGVMSCSKHRLMWKYIYAAVGSVTVLWMNEVEREEMVILSVLLSNVQ